MKAAVPVLIRTIEQGSGLSIYEISVAMMVVTEARTPAGMVRNWHRWRAEGGDRQAIPSKQKLSGILHIARKNKWLPADLPVNVVDLISVVESNRALALREARDQALARMEECAMEAFNAHRMYMGSSFEALEDTIAMSGQMLANVMLRWWQLEYSPGLGAKLEGVCEQGLQKARAFIEEEIEFRKTGDQKPDPNQPTYDPDFDEGEPESVGFLNLKSRSTKQRSQS